MGSYNTQKASNVMDGVDPKRVLERRGVEYEGSSFLPNFPDYLGYALGLMLIWLVYTGFSSIIAIVSNPNSTVSRMAALAGDALSDDKAPQAPSSSNEFGDLGKRLSPSNARKQHEQDKSRAQLTANKGWFQTSLDFLNGKVDRAAIEVANSLKGVVGSAELSSGIAPPPPISKERVEPDESVDLF